MATLNGFLSQNRPGILPRLTDGQKALILRAAEEVLLNLNASDRARVDDVVVARETLKDALERYPSDRSCATCDFLSGSYCHHWHAEIPDQAALEAGCERWQDDGAPF